MTKCQLCDCCGEARLIDDLHDGNWGVFMIKNREVWWDLCEACSQRLINTLTDWGLENKNKKSN